MKSKIFFFFLIGLCITAPAMAKDVQINIQKIEPGAFPTIHVWISVSQNATPVKVFEKADIRIREEQKGFLSTMGYEIQAVDLNHLSNGDYILVYDTRPLLDKASATRVVTIYVSRHGDQGSAQFTYVAEQKTSKEKSAALFQFGLALYNAGQYETAADNFAKVLEMDTSYPEAGDYLAKSKRTYSNALVDQGANLFLRDKLDNASELFKKAYKTDPDNKNAEESLVKCEEKRIERLFEEETKQPYLKRDYTPVEKEIAEFLKIVPENKMAKQYLEKIKKFEETRTRAKQSLTDAQTDFKAVSVKTADRKNFRPVLKKIKKILEAAPDFREAADFQKQVEAAHKQALKKQANFKAAKKAFEEKAFEKAAALFKGLGAYPGVSDWLAKIYNQKDRMAISRKYHDEAMALFKDEKYAQALEKLELARNMAPDDTALAEDLKKCKAELLLLKGRELMKKESFVQAMAPFSEAISILPDYKPAVSAKVELAQKMIIRGKELLDKHDYAGAKEIFEALLDAGDNTVAGEYLKQCNQKLGVSDGADGTGNSTTEKTENKTDKDTVISEGKQGDAAAVSSADDGSAARGRRNKLMALIGIAMGVLVVLLSVYFVKKRKPAKGDYFSTDDNIDVPPSPDLCPYCGQPREYCVCQTQRTGPAPTHAAPELSLYAEKGPYSGREFHVVGKETSIGRNERNDICIIDEIDVSRFHAVFNRLEDGRYAITDLNSTNGVYVNDKKTEYAILTHGDIIKMGTTQMRVLYPKSGD